ncbi:MAG: hypothetical protein AB1815_05370 [Bacillota bacterium]
MKYVSFSEVGKIYECGNTSVIVRHFVNYPEFGQFCLRLKQFERLLGDASGDGFWRPLLLKLKRYRFEMCASPLPFDHPAVFPPSLSALLYKTLKQCQEVYPGYVEHLENLLLCLKTLAESSANPLLDSLAGLFNRNGMHKTALLLKESRLIPFTEKIIQPNIYNYVDCINIQQYRGPKCYQAVIVIGPARWYPEFIFSAPRATEIHLLSYKWIMDKWKLRPVFAASFNNASDESPGRQRTGNESVVPEVKMLIADTYIDCDEILPAINWDEISSGISKKHFQDGTGTGYETVEAKLFLLEGLAAVFLDGNAKVLVIDLDEDEGDDDKEEARVKRIHAEAVQEGMYLLLRTSGGGEYIIPVADQILGDYAQRARECQKHWKMLLRDNVNSKGSQAVANSLKSLGSVRANETNVRNWMGERSIKTADYNDFLAIMRLIKMEKDAPEYWKLAEAIDEAHRKAGFHIRKLLMKQVLSADLSILEKTGKMDFELEEEDGGSLTAFRVTGISPAGYTVPLAKVGHPFEREDDGYGHDDSSLR